VLVLQPWEETLSVDPMNPSIRDVVESVYRTDSRRVFATLVRLLRDFDLAEESMHEAFATAVEQWAAEGVPANPRAWLVSVGRFKAIDSLRRRSRRDASLQEVAERLEETASANADQQNQDIEDDRLRLIFTCCHPAVPHAAQVALTLREVCGLTTEEIARAFLTTPSTIAQRIVRGKSKIRDAGIPFCVPSVPELPQRLEPVLSVIYLVFNEGYSAHSGDSLTRADLSGEAIRLGQLVVELLPDAEALGLLALMLFQESRRHARSDADGNLVLLDDQDRSLWDRSLIEEGRNLVLRALSDANVGMYTIQAAIASVHSTAATAAETDWGRIVEFYDLLLRASPSPVVELNRAVAVAMCQGPQAGLDLVNGILERGDLTDYHLAHAARADFYRRLGSHFEARRAYQQALTLARQQPERRFLERRIRELDTTT